MKINDVIHGEIEIDGLATKIIETKEFKRLKGISQTGTSTYEFDGLKDNNRYDHSIGSYHVMKMMIERFRKNLEPFNIHIDPVQENIALAAMLIHDIGHGPLSHTFERVLGVSHEKMTTRILRDPNTEIHKVLEEYFSKEDIKKLIAFIHDDGEGNDINKFECNNLLNILRALVSNQIDADRLDYLLRDAYYASYPSSIDINKVIENLKITIDFDKWVLVGEKKGISAFETVLFERSRNYRDIYLCTKSILGDIIFTNIVKTIVGNEKIHNSISGPIKDLITMKEGVPLDSFIKIQDKDLFNLIEELKDKVDNPIVKYILNINNNLDDYLEIGTEKPINEIIERIKEIFSDVPDVDNIEQDNIPFIVDSEVGVKVYNANGNQGIKIDNYGIVDDITKHSSIVKNTQLSLKNRFFNPHLLMLKLGITQEDFDLKYKDKIKELIDWSRSPQIEFELKYLVDENATIDYSLIKKVLMEEEYQITGIKNVHNCDSYYDTPNYTFLNRDMSLRIRQKYSSDNQKLKYRVTFKSPTGESAAFSTRHEYEYTIAKPDFNIAKAKLEGITPFLEEVDDHPVLIVNNNRYILEVVKNGVKVDFAFDNVIYRNVVNGNIAAETMVEIEPTINDGCANRVVLADIHKIIREKIPMLAPHKEPNKYHSGIQKTSGIINEQTIENNIAKVKNL